MDVPIIIARLIHVLGGIFWVGAVIFVTVYLGPAINDVGPDGGKVMGAIMRRGYMRVVPIVAVLTILSGLWLLWIASSGFHHDYLFSGPGHVYVIGGTIAIIAFAVGMTVTRPAMMKAMALSQSAGSAEPAERESMLAEAQRLRIRGSKGGMVVMWLLILAAVAMAVGRYV